MESQEGIFSRDSSKLETTTKPSVSQTRKKYVAIGTFTVLIVALILTSILVDLYIENRNSSVEFTIKLDGHRTQKVTSNPNQNTVKYYVLDHNHEAWILNDFNTDIKVTKIKTKTETACFVTPLNRSKAMEPSMLTKLDDENTQDYEKRDSTGYQISENAIKDISFMNKEAQNMCNEVSVYWLYPSCDDNDETSGFPTKTSSKAAKRSDPSDPYGTWGDDVVNGTNYMCINNCCKSICACKVWYTWNIVGNAVYCKWFYYKCCPGTTNCYFKKTCSTTTGLFCENGVC